MIHVTLDPHSLVSYRSFTASWSE